jgi:hypothetical protein
VFRKFGYGKGGVLISIFRRVHSRCLPAVSGGRDIVRRDRYRYAVVTASSRDVCLRCQVAATILDAGAFNRIFVRV